MGKLYVISSDEKVRSSFAKLEEIETYSKLSDFIKSSEVQNVFHESILTDRIYDICEILQENEELNKGISKTIEIKIHEFIQDKNVNDFKHEDLDIDFHIQESSDVDNIDLNFDESSYFGDGLIGIPFGLEIQIDVSFPLLKTEASSMYPSYSYSIKDLNNHYFLVESSYKSSMFGEVSIRFAKDKINIGDINNDDLNFDEVIAAIDYDSIKIEVIDDLDLRMI